MRVLLCTHPEADHGEYALWHGFNALFGEGVVVDLPTKLSYRGEVHRYPRTWGHDRTEGCTGPYEYAVARPDAPRLGEGDVVALARRGEIGVVIVGSPRPVAVAALHSIRAHLSPDVPIVLIDAEDHADTAQSVRTAVGLGARIVFKRELLPSAVTWDRHGPLGVVPLPLGTYWLEPPSPADAPRGIDVLCAVGHSHPARALAVAALQRSGLRVDVGHYGYGEYVRRLGRARIVVAPRGHGYDTVRRWEVPACGAFLLAERLPLVEPEHPMRDGVHCAYYDPDVTDGNPTSLVALARRWADDESARAAVATAGQAHVFTHHAPVARARHVLEHVRRVYGVDLAPAAPQGAAAL